MQKDEQYRLPPASILPCLCHSASFFWNIFALSCSRRGRWSCIARCFWTFQGLNAAYLFLGMYQALFKDVFSRSLYYSWAWLFESVEGKATGLSRWIAMQFYVTFTWLTDKCLRCISLPVCLKSSTCCIPGGLATLATGVCKLCLLLRSVGRSQLLLGCFVVGISGWYLGRELERRDVPIVYHRMPYIEQDLL